MTLGAPRGFTLLELLLVMTIIGILASVVVVNLATGNTQRQLQAEAERLALAVEMARAEALRSNEIWGLAVVNVAGGLRLAARRGSMRERIGNAYVFQRYRQDDGGWEDVERRPFTRRTAAEGVVFAARTTFDRRGRTAIDSAWDAAVPGDEDDPRPIAAIYPGGEMTPVYVRVAMASQEDDGWLVRSDGIARVQALPARAAAGETVASEAASW